MKRSAGLLLYKIAGAEPVVLLVHPGGPYWAGKDLGSWSIPKGEYEAGEEPLAAAIREFREETGMEADGPFLELGEIVQANRKSVVAWAVEGDFDPARLVSNSCEIEWPPKSRQILTIPEIDRAEWFTLSEAWQKINAAQGMFLKRLAAALSSR